MGIEAAWPARHATFHESFRVVAAAAKERKRGFAALGPPPPEQSTHTALVSSPSLAALHLST